MAQQKTSKLSKSRGFLLDFKLPNRYNQVATKTKTTRGGLKMYQTVKTDYLVCIQHSKATKPMVVNVFIDRSSHFTTSLLFCQSF